MEHCRKNEPMSLHTTFHTGGPADLFYEPENADELREIIRSCAQDGLPCFVIGNGSNLLVGDGGIRGAVIALGRSFARVAVNGTEVRAEAGALLSNVASAALKASLAGMEFASGIPGSVGGAVFMNAGAYGGEMKDILLSAAVLERDGSVREAGPEELELGYRTSNIGARGRTVLAATFRLTPGNAEEISAKMKELNARRREKQPLEFYSAGSTFKRPAGYFAGKLIEEAGLRGFRVGGAQISEKHCGFVINRGDATSADIRKLIGETVRRVREQSGVTLEPEVKMIGEF